MPLGDGERVDFFVAHAWADKPSRRVDALRAFLLVQPLVANAVAMSLIIGLAVLPLGFLLSDDFWFVPTASVAGLGLLFVLWVTLTGWVLHAPNLTTDPLPHVVCCRALCSTHCQRLAYPKLLPAPARPPARLCQ